MEPEKKRYYYLDVLKAIAMFFVCSYHFTLIYKVQYEDGYTAYTLFNRFLVGIGSVCIPLFFMINGSLLLNSTIKLNNHLKKSLSIFSRHIIWRAITITALSLYAGINLLKLNPIQIINDVFFFDNSINVDLSHFWFIPCLLGIYFLVPLIKTEFDCFFDRPNQSYLTVFMIVLFIFSFLIKDISTLLKLFPQGNDIAISNFAEKLNPFAGLIGPMLFYFLAGGMFHRSIDKIRLVKSTYLVLIFLSGALLLLGKWYVETSFAKDNWDIVYSAYASTPTLMMSGSLFVLISKAEGWAKMPLIAPFFKLIGNNTMNVYYLHWILGYYISKYYNGFTSIPLDYVKAFLMVVLLSSVSELLKKIPVIKKLLH